MSYVWPHLPCEAGLEYVVPLVPDAEYPPELFSPSWNVAPGSMQPVIFPDGPRLEHWGYRPEWAVARRVPMLVNARLDKANSSAWKLMWNGSRVIVPADGWDEWVLEEGAKQSYFIQPIDGKPLFLAGLSTIAPGGDGDGFVIVTDASDAGMLDIHDRRPLVLSAEEAKQWLDPETTFAEANHLANSVSTPPEAFRWFRVSKGVNKAGNNEPAFNESIDETEPSPQEKP
ncbi:SOS response-associated peptidase [Caballeronia sp. SBC2]|uniref:SOS response-associated peptidase n=1 Tax=Caballeronia sp. SBC2 TaxID=2705547 RepID=UPI0013E151DF|nr:SOS response-associated peptidase [Caballeronia sp. SBC2]QIE22589.1 SOS response-associated protein YedK [Caballeronia sp. SBC2]